MGLETWGVATPTGVTYPCSVTAPQVRSATTKTPSLTAAVKILATLKKTLKDNDPKIGSAMNNLALAYSSVNRHSEALQLKKETLQFFQRVLPGNDVRIGKAMYNLAFTYTGLNRHSEAVDMGEATLYFFTETAKLKSVHSDVLDTMNNLVLAYIGLGKYRKALQMAKKLLTLYKKNSSPHSDIVAITKYVDALEGIHES